MAVALRRGGDAGRVRLVVERVLPGQVDHVAVRGHRRGGRTGRRALLDPPDRAPCRQCPQATPPAAPWKNRRRARFCRPVLGSLLLAHDPNTVTARWPPSARSARADPAGACTVLRQLGRVGGPQLRRVQHVAARLGRVLVRLERRVHVVELLADGRGQCRVDLVQTRLEVRERLLCTLHVRREVDQVEVAVCLLLALDLVRLDLLEQTGRAVGQILRLVRQPLGQDRQLLGVGLQLGGVLLRLGGDLPALPEIALDRVQAVPADRGVKVRGPHVEEVVQVALVVARLRPREHEPGHRGLDLLVERPGEGVLLLGRGHVAAVDGGPQVVDRGLHVAQGLGGVRPVVLRTRGQQGRRSRRSGMAPPAPVTVNVVFSVAAPGQ